MRLGGLGSDDDVGAIACGTLGNGQTDATATAGDEYRLSSQRTGVLPFRVVTGFSRVSTMG